ncbi:MAG: glycosyltransferase family 4 protein [Desulfobulbus sp.]
MKILIVGAYPDSLINFRGNLIKDMIVAGHSVTAIANGASYEVISKLASMDVNYLDYPINRRSINPINDSKTLLSLFKIIKRNKPDVVLAYTIKPIIWGGLASRIASVRSFYAMIEGLGFAFQEGGRRRRLLGSLVVFLYKISLQNSKKVIFLNPDNQNTFLNKKIIDVKKSVIIDGIGVDLDYYQNCPLPPSINCRLIFLTIGRLLGEKGFREYAQAANIVKARYPETVFRLVGPVDASSDGIPINEVEVWEKSGWIEYLGESRDVRTHLIDCHVYVLPSYHEGLPRTIQEAMAIGRPILTTDVPGCRETVIPGDNGWLVPKADAQALADSMIWFIENSDELQRMAKRSRQMAEKRFDVHKINRELMEIMGLSPEENFHSKARSPEEV